jgi:Na+/phosphate symporter
MSNNIGRFFLALISSILIIFGLGLVIILLFIPGLITLAIFWAIFSIVAVIIGFLFAGSFLWYIARVEPKEENISKNYSIKQGKDAEK